MKRSNTVLLSHAVAFCSLLAFSVSNSHAAEASQAAFKSWSNFFHGGVWRTTVNEQHHEHRYEKIYNGQLQVGETVDGGLRSRIVVGLDPANEECRLWQFGSDGCVTVFSIKEIDPNTWVLTGKGSGPQGETRYRSKVTRIGPNSTNEEVLEYVVNGTKHPKTVRAWRRTKE